MFTAILIILAVALVLVIGMSLMGAGPSRVRRRTIVERPVRRRVVEEPAVRERVVEEPAVRGARRRGARYDPARRGRVMACCP